jgi:hypothetical protein
MTGPNVQSLLAVLAELDQLRALALGLAERDAPSLWPAPAPDAGLVRSLWEVLLAARRAVFANPSAARGVVDVLVAEGRRYAEATDEGRALRDRLVASDAVDQLRRVWETVTLNVLDGPTTSGLPDAWIELVVDAATAAPVGGSGANLPRGTAGSGGGGAAAADALDGVLTQLRPEGFA